MDMLVGVQVPLEQLWRTLTYAAQKAYLIIQGKILLGNRCQKTALSNWLKGKQDFTETVINTTNRSPAYVTKHIIKPNALGVGLKVLGRGGFYPQALLILKYERGSILSVLISVSEEPKDVNILIFTRNTIHTRQNFNSSLVRFKIFHSLQYLHISLSTDIGSICPLETQSLQTS